MNDWNFGSIDGRQLALRWIVPWAFREWTGNGFRLYWPRLFNPVAWWRAARLRESWRWWCKRFVGTTHRCYCGNGALIDGHLVLCGWGVVWFYSHYTGEIPCTCDRVIEEMFGDAAEGEQKTARVLEEEQPPLGRDGIPD